MNVFCFFTYCSKVLKDFIFTDYLAGVLSTNHLFSEFNSVTVIFLFLFRDHRHHLRVYSCSFDAQDCLDWLIAENEAPSRPAAIFLMNVLQKNRILHHGASMRHGTLFLLSFSIINYYDQLSWRGLLIHGEIYLFFELKSPTTISSRTSTSFSVSARTTTRSPWRKWHGSSFSRNACMIGMTPVVSHRPNLPSTRRSCQKPFRRPCKADLCSLFYPLLIGPLLRGGHGAYRPITQGWPWFESAHYSGVAMVLIGPLLRGDHGAYRPITQGWPWF